MKACQNCRHGLRDQDGATPFIICTLIPPTPSMQMLPDPRTPGATSFQVAWLRPSMNIKGFCGQFRLSFRALFGYGARA